MIKACKRSHSYPKHLKRCPDCEKSNNKRWYEANSEQKKATNKVWYEANKEQDKARKKIWVANNAQQVKTTKKAWYEKNKERHKATMKAWDEANSSKRNAIVAKRKAKKLQATPTWLTQEQLNQIERYYQVAKWVESILEIPIHVDHIVPLQGKEVSGLHVPWNLQLLPASINQSKGNRTLHG